MEELVNADKIIRPAYKSVAEKRIYQPIDKRQERELAGEITVKSKKNNAKQDCTQFSTISKNA